MTRIGVISGIVAIALAATPPLAAQDTPAPRPADLQAGPAAAAAAVVPREPRVGPETGLPLPRFVSLKTDEGNARRGPSRSHRIDWVFTRRDMPVMVIDEYGHWRRVVDRDGQGGWIHYALLSGSRTGIVEVDMLELRQRPDMTAPVRAQAELGVIGRLEECRPDWCLMEVGGYSGWVPADALWGVRPGEVFD